MIHLADKATSPMPCLIASLCRCLFPLKPLSPLAGRDHDTEREDSDPLDP